MADERFKPIRDQPPGRGPNRRRFCRGPHAEPVEVERGRQSWCSEACCVDAYVASGRDVRFYVEKRDRGVCALCGANARRAVRLLRRLGRGRKGRRKARGYNPDAVALVRGAWGVTAAAKHLWEADHIIPVSEGGGGCGLSGYRTLCRPCHNGETERLRLRRQGERSV